MTLNLQNHIQNIFGCSSGNYHKYPNLWMENIEKFIPFLNMLIDNGTINDVNTEIIEDNWDNYNKDDLTLKKLFQYYKSDKGDDTGYWPIYTELLKKYKNKHINVFEIGLGTNDPNLISTMGNNGNYKCGSSLRAFRDYLPNANIYGADIDKNCLFSESRIETYFIDQLNPQSFELLKKQNLKFDFFIDDGLHSITANLGSLIYALDNINDNGTIVIEDIPVQKLIGYKLIDKIIKLKYNNFQTKIIYYKNKTGFIYVLFKL